MNVIAAEDATFLWRKFTRLLYSPVAGTDKRAIPSVQSFFAVSIPQRCAL